MMVIQLHVDIVVDDDDYREDGNKNDGGNLGSDRAQASF